MAAAAALIAALLGLLPAQTSTGGRSQPGVAQVRQAGGRDAGDRDRAGISQPGRKTELCTCPETRSVLDLGLPSLRKGAR